MEIKIVELQLMTISETEFSESNHVSLFGSCLLMSKQRRNLKRGYGVKAIEFVINQPEKKRRNIKIHMFFTQREKIRKKVQSKIQLKIVYSVGSWHNSASIDTHISSKKEAHFAT